MRGRGRSPATEYGQALAAHSLPELRPAACGAQPASLSVVPRNSATGSEDSATGRLVKVRGSTRRMPGHSHKLCSCLCSYSCFCACNTQDIIICSKLQHFRLGSPTPSLRCTLTLQNGRRRARRDTSAEVSRVTSSVRWGE